MRDDASWNSRLGPYYTPLMEPLKTYSRYVIRGGLPGQHEKCSERTCIHPVMDITDAGEYRWLHTICAHWGSRYSTSVYCRTVLSNIWTRTDRNLYKPPDIPSNRLFIHYYQTIDSPNTSIFINHSFKSNSSKTTTTITMHFVKVIFTLMAASAVMAAPAQDATAKAQVDCPNGWSQCGVRTHIL